MNTFTLHIIGFTIGHQAFKSGLSCTPMADKVLTEKLKVVSPSAQESLTKSWLDGWRRGAGHE